MAIATKVLYYIGLFVLVTLSATLKMQAQTKHVFKRNGYSLTVLNNDTSFDKAVILKLENTFFAVYPKLVKEYNARAIKKVTFLIDTAYDGVAETSKGRVKFGAKYLTKFPKDIDVVTHEVMHIVQDYGNTNGPGWLTEGIADYARFKFGVNNDGAGWSLPDFVPSQNYDNAYRVSARFLLWLEKHVKPNLVKILDGKMRANTFTDQTWRKETGKTVDELWVAYAANPSL